MTLKADHLSNSARLKDQGDYRSRCTAFDSCDTNLCLGEEDAPFPPLGQRELHRLRVRHAARRQAAHVGHGVAHAAPGGATHQSGNCKKKVRKVEKKNKLALRTQILG